MKNIPLFIFILMPFFINGQDLSTVRDIDIYVSRIENDMTIAKRVFDTTSYEKEDGGKNWDSAYYHREVYYMDGKIVKIITKSSYGNWRNDRLAYYQNNRPIKFSDGESFKSQSDYGSLDFEIYYHNDKDIQVNWLTPKPENVIRVGTDEFLQIAYSILENAR